MIKTSIKTRGLPISAKVEKGLRRMRDDLHDDLIAFTPIDTGHAQRRWRKTATGSENRVEYIVPLEEGHSKQAPDGITVPAINKLIRRSKSKKYFR
jgi:hypothetical protein